MRGISRLCIVLLFLLCHGVCHAQQFALGTNVIGWADFITINGEASVVCGRHFTVNARARYNPWTFNRGNIEKEVQNRKRAIALGVRYWPWHSYSGWFYQLDGQWEEYNRGGFFSNRTSEEGRAWGGVASFGYDIMLGERWNVEFGAGVFMGMKDYTKYECTTCGHISDRGQSFFVLPDDVKVSFIFLF